MSGAQLRADAARAVYAVLEQRQSLRECLPKIQQPYDSRDSGWLNEVVYGVLRQLPTIQFWLKQLLDKPLQSKQKPVECLLMVGLYQLAFTRVSDHAAVSETVNACQSMGQDRLKGLVNAVLRNAQRGNLFEQQSDQSAAKLNLPKWLYRQLKAAYPNDYELIAAASHQPAPLWLRVNQRHCSRQQYQALLDESDIGYEVVESEQLKHAIKLTQRLDITRLPGFEDGWFSVQDGAAQHAAALLECQTGDRVLDMCAAPGGKTAHLLEHTPDIDCLAVDGDKQRLQRVYENLKRLRLDAKVKCGDGTQPHEWWDGHAFDRILLDAPCSATGVIRRHPDIKWLRKGNDIETLQALQTEILEQCWSMLRTGGTLLYATCSILPQENREQIAQFLSQHDNAQLVPIHNQDTTEYPGWQIHPGDRDMDGFYYARLIKC